MKIVYCSNFMNHHQLPLANAFQKQGNEYTFIADTSVPRERITLGYQNMNTLPMKARKPINRHVTK